MAPDRSTTPAVTENGSRRWPVALAALAVTATLVIAAVLLRPEESAPTAAPQSPPSAPSLVVGDGRTVTLLSLGGSATDALLDRVAAGLGDATEQVERFWGTDWTREITVVATDSPAQFAGAAPGAPAEMAAVAVADSVDTDRRVASGQRIVLGPGAGRMSDAALRVVLTHELFHYAARADTAPDAPRWITEAVADYLARPAPDATTPPVPAPVALPADSDFESPEPGLSQAYDRAWLFARFVADRHGPAALRELYRRAAGRHMEAVDTVLRDVTGADPGQLLQRWRQWLAEPR
ncbi:hypothetical protein [[Mycobacterium] wendilense]|uniref:Peptidase n=1 Tax=[Mycobacterium] wendilense TaxID=3064284 RepID=A0ABM9MCY1_9MYCO|nr:hypothetical protein [Mycolicibacterium sp. MU0050]CAJ1582197.1 hypothetical protein MU0050_001952 [Mycolicibacterium sp. MU0050]